MAYRCGPSGLDIEIESDLSVLSLLFKLVSGHDHKPPNVALVEIHLYSMVPHCAMCHTRRWPHSTKG